MSLRNLATKAATETKTEARRAAAERWQAELRHRLDYVVKALEPLATPDNCALVAEQVTIPYLDRFVDHGAFGSGIRYSMTAITGTHVKIDDVDFLIYKPPTRAGTASGCHDTLQVSPLVACKTCSADTLPADDYSIEHVWTINSTTPGYREKSLAEGLGKILQARWLCAEHRSAAVSAACEKCHRPFHEE